MFYRLKRSFNYARLDASLTPVLKSAPVTISGDGEYTAVTQVCKRDLLMYLVAAKSFFRFAPPRRAVVLNDGSLERQDCEELARHIGGIEIVDIATIDSSPCPKRGCWERLMLVIRLSEEDYVIQLDCDTLTLAPPLALLEFVKSGTSFTQGTRDGRSVTSMAEHCARLNLVAKADSHVQVAAEADFPRLKRYAELRYVRGCAGFSGFGRGSVDRALMLELNAELEAILGSAKWSEWGSEQVMSNLLVANSARAAVLPYPEYGAFTRTHDISNSVFLHFMGPDRFYGNVYGRLGGEFIKGLR